MKRALFVLFLGLPVLLIALAVPGPVAVAETATCTITVYGTVFYDQDGDSAQSLSEQGLRDIRVNLYKDSDGDGRLTPADPWLANTITDEQGHYRFAAGPGGRYHVAVNLPPHYGPTDGLHRLVITPGCEMYSVQAGDFGLTGHGLRQQLWLPIQSR